MLWFIHGTLYSVARQWKTCQRKLPELVMGIRHVFERLGGMLARSGTESQEA